MGCNVCTPQADKEVARVINFGSAEKDGDHQSLTEHTEQ